MNGLSQAVQQKMDDDRDILNSSSESMLKKLALLGYFKSLFDLVFGKKK